MELTTFSHGKQSVRIGKVRRKSESDHEFVEYAVDVQLEGATKNSFTQGDNSMVIATDTVKNNCYYVAKYHSLNTPEEFALALGEHFLHEYDFVTGVRIETRELPWTRANVDGRSHCHGFVRGAHGVHVSKLEMRRSDSAAHESILSGGIEGLEFAGMELQGETAGLKFSSTANTAVMDCIRLDVLKTTQSGWENFYSDRFTTLPETNDRILATTISATWHFQQTSNVQFGCVHDRVMQTLFTEFFGDPIRGTFSPGLQRTEYQIATGILDVCPEVDEVKLVLPNLHFLPCTIPAFVKNGIPFENDIFIPTDEPRGRIECTVRRI